MKVLRSPKEIRFRLKQELSNLGLFASRPTLTTKSAYVPLVELPVVATITGRLEPDVRNQILRIADKALKNRFPILATEIDCGLEVDWRRDFVSGKTSGLGYFRSIPYLDFDKVGDHKVIWELSRHQHWVALAQAWAITGDTAYRDTIARLFASWTEQNPYCRGINWTSALEVAFRALSWVWVYHLCGETMPQHLRLRLVDELYRHGHFLANNLSVYFSPNTHLLGELVALHALGSLFPMFPEAGTWRKASEAALDDLILTQIREDGSYFEQSSYYHVYALDMFLFHRVLAKKGEAYDKRLASAAEYLATLLGPAGELASFGDDDGGRFFHPWGHKECFGRATLATAAVVLGRSDIPYDPYDLHEMALWWKGPSVLDQKPGAVPKQGLQRFPEAGVAIHNTDNVQIVFKGGELGKIAGHSHADLLSLILRRGEERLLIDPGTFTYLGDAKLRDWFRGTSAHNTVRVGGRDQAIPRGPFHWSEKPVAGPAGADETGIFGECSYGGFTHRRRLVIKANWLIVADDITGPDGEHLVEQFWHFGVPAAILSPGSFRIGKSAKLYAAAGTSRELEEGREFGWNSPAYGVREPGFALHLQARLRLPARLLTFIDLDGSSTEVPSEIQNSA